MPATAALPRVGRSPPAAAHHSAIAPYDLGFSRLREPPPLVGALPNLSEKAQSPDWKPYPGSKAAPNTEDVMGNCPPGSSVNNTSEAALAHQTLTAGQHMQLLAQILVNADLVQGNPPAEATMVWAFGQPVGGHKHAWEDVWRAAVDRLQNQKSPMTGLETPCSSRIGSCTAEQASKDTAVGKTMISEPHSSKTHPNSLQHDGGEKASQGMDDANGRIQPAKQDPGHDELNLQTAGILPSVSCNEAIQGDACGEQTSLESHCCNVALYDKSSEASSLSKKNTGKNMANIQKSCHSRSVPNSPRDGNEEGAKRASNKKIMGNTVVDTSNVHCSDGFSGFAAACLLSGTDNMPFCTQDEDINSLIEGLTEQDLCVKCGKDGQLLKCSSCFLAAHDSCFGSSVRFDDSGQFYCPVCFYNKATEAYKKSKETYSEARKNLSAFLGSKQFAKQHDEQSTGKQQRAANSEDHLNGCSTSKRQANHQSEAANISRKDEEPGHQKTNATSDACPEEVVTEKTTFGPNSENAEAHEEDGNSNSSHEVPHSSQNRCSPVANHNIEADKENGLMNSHNCEISDEIGATSWRNMSHRKVRFQEKGTVVSNSYKKALGCQDQLMPSPSRKRYYAYPLERYFNPRTPARSPLVPTRRPSASTARRTRLLWTEGEEAALREAVAKFAPKNKGQISWVQIREYGRDVFHKARRPDDLRAKWKNMKKK